MKGNVIIICALFLFSCNKEKKLMNGLVGNWNIEISKKTIMYSDGHEDELEYLLDAGKLVIYEDPNNPSKESKFYDLFFVDSHLDTLSSQNKLITDERNARIILKNAVNDSSYHSDMVWTIEQERKNKQTWVMHGVDSTFYYPSNNLNPGSADNWVVWRLTLKKEN